ncbi:hypothetical protein CQ016_08705 [Arthrobacter sp. MYb222]|nr:hypothetical protein CQ016_08705 [Arthrobacter sp. MYb222]
MSMKRFLATATALAGILSMAACGVSAEEFEAAQTSSAAIAAEKEALQAQLAEAEVQLALAPRKKQQSFAQPRLRKPRPTRPRRSPSVLWRTS